MESSQSHMATATARPPVSDSRDTASPWLGFDQSKIFTRYRMWDLILYIAVFMFGNFMFVEKTGQQQSSILNKHP